jgi:hypothetical protein
VAQGYQVKLIMVFILLFISADRPSVTYITCLCPLACLIIHASQTVLLFFVLLTQPRLQAPNGQVSVGSLVASI